MVGDKPICEVDVHLLADTVALRTHRDGLSHGDRVHAVGGAAEAEMAVAGDSAEAVSHSSTVLSPDPEAIQDPSGLKAMASTQLS